jgi:hypothetical protein
VEEDDRVKDVDQLTDEQRRADEDCMNRDGPTVRSPDGNVDLTAAAQRLGLRGQVMAAQNLWNNICKHQDGSELYLVNSLVEGMDRLLSTTRADRDNFDFKHWYKPTPRSTKSDWVRVRATMYVDEQGNPWVHLTESPNRAHRWRGHSHG